MTERHLVGCPWCVRHVRVTEQKCPFCQATLPASLRESAPPRGPAVRLSRAALLALGALGTGTLAAAPGCDSGMSISPPYGLAPFPVGYDDASDATTRDAGDHTSDATINTAPSYGISPVHDAGDAEED
jgi:hypothetical protein